MASELICPDCGSREPANHPCCETCGCPFHPIGALARSGDEHPEANFDPGFIQLPRGVHSPPMAMGLTLCCCVIGGQMYNRQFPKAVISLSLHAGTAFLTHGYSLLVTWPVFLLDSYLVAKRIRSGERVSVWRWF